MLSLFSLTRDGRNRALKRLIRRVSPWQLDFKSPASRLTLATARKQWRLIVINLFSSVFEALTEGATLGIIFLAIQLLTNSGKVTIQAKPLSLVFGWLTDLSGQIPTKFLFFGLLVLALAFQVIQSFSRYVNMASAGLFAARVQSSITVLIHTQILAFSFACASQYKVGDLLNTANTAPRVVETQVIQFSNIFANAILAVGYLAVLLTLSPWLLLAAIILGLFLSQFQARLFPKIKQLSLSAVEVMVDISSMLTQDIQGLRVIHSLGIADKAANDLKEKISDYEIAVRRQILLKETLVPLTSFLPVLGIAIIAGLSVLFFGTKSTGVLPSLVTFVLALQRLNQRFTAIATSLNQTAVNAGSIQRLNLLLSPGDKVFRRHGGLAFTDLKDSIVIQDVSLRYFPDNPAALSRLNLVIPKGSTVALVGSSGSGKSSLADLLVGLYEPTAGAIYIDEVNLHSYEISSWQQRIGVVSQDTFLFNTTIAENISYGTSGYRHQDIIKAAQLAQADRFIQQLPLGYDTIVGERGYQLSGGQRQRISLARALLKHPTFLILDEATSALDSRNERLVQTAIEQLDSCITILIIAHRLSTIVKADMICVMEAGTIVEHGSHDELICLKGKYYQLWKQQQNAAQLDAL
jgi:subfamily B ATP-binding cassette protein MsbA